MHILKKVNGKMINFEAITTLYSKNSMVLTYTDSTGTDIDTLELSDGITKKTLQFSYDGSGRMTGFTTTVEDA